MKGLIKLILVSVFLWVLVLSAVQAATIYVPDDYQKIQWAVSNASKKDTIIIRDGVYHVNEIVVDKQLTIKSENGSKNCIVVGNYSAIGDPSPLRSYCVFKLLADRVTIEGLTLIQGSEGVCVFSDGNVIKGNNVSMNFNYGVYIGGYGDNYLGDYDDNAVVQNNISFNGGGIFVGDGSDNTLISGNTILLNSRDPGIRLEEVTNTEIKGNLVSQNFEGISIAGSNYTTVKENIISGAETYGLEIYSSGYNTVINNEILSSENGLYITWSVSNIVYYNNVTNNLLGIYIENSEIGNNYIFLNNFIHNEINGDIFTVYKTDKTTIWNTMRPVSYKYSGKNFRGYLGNYWDDYEYGDADGDGVGDGPYLITYKSVDYFPLVLPFEYYKIHGKPIAKNPKLTSQDQQDQGPYAQ